jgi:hypothetical protein
MTMLRRFALGGILLAAASSRVSAQAPWMPLAPGKGLQAELDTSSVRHASDGSIVARVREFRGGGIGRVPRTFTVELTHFDCRGGRSRILEIRDDVAGVLPPRQGADAPDTTRWVRYSRGSLGGEIHAAVCRVAGAPGANQSGAGT